MLYQLIDRLIYLFIVLFKTVGYIVFTVVVVQKEYIANEIRRWPASCMFDFGALPRVFLTIVGTVWNDC